LKRSAFVRSLDSSTQNKLLLQVARDVDAVQSNASIVAVICAVFLLLKLTPAEVTIVFALGILFVLGVFFVISVMPPGKYKYFTRGPFTPLAVLLIILNVIG